jgi:hypothetical protein
LVGVDICVAGPKTLFFEAIFLREAEFRHWQTRWTTLKSAPKKSRAQVVAQKKEQGASPAPKIVSTLFPRKIGFDFD